KVATDTSGNASGTFTYTAAGGDGTYSFYTVATDKAGNVQATPASAQSTTLLDTTAPPSTASPPPSSDSAFVTVSFSASDNQGESGPAKLDLHANPPRRSADLKVATDTSGNATGSFTYTAAGGDGTYSFYTVATDKAGNAQAAPATAQTSTL